MTPRLRSPKGTFMSNPVTPPTNVDQAVILLTQTQTDIAALLGTLKLGQPQGGVDSNLVSGALQFNGYSSVWQ